MEFKYLGKRTTQPTKTLDTFSTPENVSHIKFESDELTSFCPVTGQPDFSRVVIEYIPDKLCIESKSLKLYLWSYREEPIFAEGLASRIVEDIFNAVNPKSVQVTIIQNVRGGIQLTATAEKKASTEK
jgi:7-cyano-7-deazaguanine reductase